MSVSRTLRPSGKTASQPMLRVSRGDGKKPLHGIESSSAIFTLACKGVGEGSVSHVEGGLKIFERRLRWGSCHVGCKQSLTRSFQIGHMCPFCRLFLAPDSAQLIDDTGVVDLRNCWGHASDFFRSSSPFSPGLSQPDRTKARGSPSVPERVEIAARGATGRFEHCFRSLRSILNGSFTISSQNKRPETCKFRDANDRRRTAAALHPV